MEWIKCSDRLPKPDIYVLCAIPEGVLLYTAYYAEGWGFIPYGEYRPDFRITHWSYLPEPPTED